MVHSGHVQRSPFVLGVMLTFQLPVATILNKESPTSKRLSSPETPLLKEARELSRYHIHTSHGMVDIVKRLTYQTVATSCAVSHNNFHHVSNITSITSSKDKSILS